MTNPPPASKPDDELNTAARKAIEATNFCTKHRLYHGHKYKSCTPQKRVLVEFKPEPLKKEAE